MNLFQRWQLRAETRALRADLDRISQRLNYNERRINQIATKVEYLQIHIHNTHVNDERNE